MTTVLKPTNETPGALPFAIPRWLAIVLVLLMGAGYTLLDVLQPSEPIYTILSFLPGLLSFTVIILAKLRLNVIESYLIPRKLSLRGGIALVVVAVCLLPILLSTSGKVGWHWIPAFVYAPASGIAQELYFRASLLPAMEELLQKRNVAAIGMHSLVFVVFHLRTFLSIGPNPIMAVVVIVLFVAGFAWGYQVQRDRTTIWAVALHSSFLVIMSMFKWG
jgi:membrane protease YdiL (CAAX protease family)